MASAKPDTEVLSELSLDFMEDLANYKETSVLRKILEDKELIVNKTKKELEEVKVEAAKYLEINKVKNNSGIRAGIRKRTENIERLMKLLEIQERELDDAKIELEERLIEDEKRGNVDDGDLDSSVGSFM